MNNIIKIIKEGKPILITYLLNYIIVIVFAIIYVILGYKDLNFFINNVCSHVINIYYVIVIIYLYKKNYIEEKKKVKYFPKIYLGISLATFLNMVIFKFNLPIKTVNISTPLIIISSGIIGPIYEEILFRYVFYNRLKRLISKEFSIVITTVIFALIHLNPVKIIYALILGFFLNIIYEKDDNILSPILIHMFANTIVIFLNEYNTYILLLSLINLIISIKINKFK